MLFSPAAFFIIGGPHLGASRVWKTDQVEMEG